MRIDGRAIAARITEGVRAEAERLAATGTRAKLGMLTATGDESSASGVGSVVRAAKRVGIEASVVSFPGNAGPETTACLLRNLVAAAERQR